MVRVDNIKQWEMHKLHRHMIFLMHLPTCHRLSVPSGALTLQLQSYRRHFGEYNILNQILGQMNHKQWGGVQPTESQQTQYQLQIIRKHRFNQRYSLSCISKSVIPTTIISVLNLKDRWHTEGDVIKGAKPQSETCTSSFSSRRRLAHLKLWCTIGGWQASCKYLNHKWMKVRIWPLRFLYNKLMNSIKEVFVCHWSTYSRALAAPSATRMRTLHASFWWISSSVCSASWRVPFLKYSYTSSRWPCSAQ